jgi:transposase
MDMSPGYLKGAAEHFPQARIVFDKFYVMLLAGQGWRRCAAKRIARGFKNFIYFLTAAYLRAGCLGFEHPVIN